MEPLGPAPGSRDRRKGLIVATHAWREWSDRIRARGLRVAGIAIILLGAGAALLPAGKTIPSDMIGGLLIASGLIETVAGSLRREARVFDMAAGIVTALAGLLFILNPETHFFPMVVPIIGWLIVRSLILAAAASETNGSVRIWTAISAMMDFLLGVLLLTGLSASTLVVSLFGPTRELVASFAWVLAASFVINGLMLLEVASCERREKP
jgi:uncharacterized membrane protein HdeD (DUF308 family)